MLTDTGLICYYQNVQIFNSFTPEVIELLKNGAVGVIPTDTVYGIVAPLFSPAAIERIYELKGRDDTKRIGTTLISDIKQIDPYVHPGHLRSAQSFWPGPVSVELGIVKGLEHAHQGHWTLAFRLPDSSRLQTLVAQTGPLATTSANHSGKALAETLGEAMAYFREGVDFYVDGGNLSGRQPSAIVRFNQDGQVEKLR